MPESAGSRRPRATSCVLFFSTSPTGNPNGDPDAGTSPGWIPRPTRAWCRDVALKGKIRNYVALAGPEEPGHEIYMRDGATAQRRARPGLGRRPAPRRPPRRRRKKLPGDGRTKAP